MPMAFSAGTMCLPKVVVDVIEGLNASPLNSTTASSSPRATDSALSSRTRVTKRATPPTGSFSLGATLYTSLKWRMVIALGLCEPCSDGVEHLCSASRTTSTRGTVRSVNSAGGMPALCTNLTADSRNTAVSVSSVQSKMGPPWLRRPSGQRSTPGLPIQSSTVPGGTPAASRLRPRGSCSSLAPVHSSLSRSASRGPADACTALFIVEGIPSRPSASQWR
mmetsp:Transcript_44806/g.124949  ORF Transcript_44806/g.124949 Transcript_44806/m.124949 type:complete len:221 (-) Transcript_44806:112-774(-)